MIRAAVALALITGPQWDSNVGRVVDDDQAAGATGVVTLLRGSLKAKPFSGHQLDLAHDAGIKVHESRGDDVLTQLVRGSWTARAGPSWWLGVKGSLKDRRQEADVRSYLLGRAALEVGVAPTPGWTLTFGPLYERFVYRPEETEGQLDHDALGAEVALTWRPAAGWHARLSGAAEAKAFEGDRLRETRGVDEPPEHPGLVLPWRDLNPVPGEARRDVVTTAAAGVGYTGDLLLSLDAWRQEDSSNSAGAGFTRWGLRMRSGATLPGQVSASLRATLQVLTDEEDPLFRLDPVRGVDDEETRSSVGLRLRRPLFGGLSIEAKAVGYFSLRDDEPEYRRWTLLGGLGYRVAM